MKRIVALTLAFLLVLSALILPAMAEESRVMKTGVLLMLNLTENEMANYRKARVMVNQLLGVEDQATNLFADAAGNAGQAPQNVEIIYFDNIDAMLMSLSVGEINTMEVYATTAQYLTHNNPELVQGIDYRVEQGANTFADLMYKGILANDFSFMMMESNTALRDQFNEALAAITEEEMNQLIQDHITAAITDGTVTPVAMPVIDGAETIRVAVTGSLPPMDYVAPDGSPAGFNTALLAEISKRINKNIELVVVDSVGRAAALATGTVDAVFWTRTNALSNSTAEMSEEELQKETENVKASMSEEEIAVMDQLLELIDFSNYGKADMPEGTIITNSYYTDTIVPVTTQTFLDSLKAQAGN